MCCVTPKRYSGEYVSLSRRDDPTGLVELQVTYTFVQSLTFRAAIFFLDYAEPPVTVAISNHRSLRAAFKPFRRSTHDARGTTT
ncbi:hypothetical protein CHU98_g99 [Xylaria longipes]|nr:hypothetical protein CHU98_g99 [Xylaria longipes]